MPAGYRNNVVNWVAVTKLTQTAILYVPDAISCYLAPRRRNLFLMSAACSPFGNLLK